RGEVRAAIKEDYRRELGAIRFEAGLAALGVEQVEISERLLVVAGRELVFGLLEDLRQRGGCTEGNNQQGEQGESGGPEHGGIVRWHGGAALRVRRLGQWRGKRASFAGGAGARGAHPC